MIIFVLSIVLLMYAKRCLQKRIMCLEWIKVRTEKKKNWKEQQLQQQKS